MRKYLVVTVIILWAIVLLPRLNKRICPFRTKPAVKEIQCIKKIETGKRTSINDAFTLVKNRQDKEALVLFEEILFAHPENIDALWGKAECLRRAHDYKQAEDLLNKILRGNPTHPPSLISLAYIRYKDDNLNEALQLINRVLEEKDLDCQSQALAYMMLGSINSKRSKKGWLFNKIMYGTQIRCHFERAKALAPDLAEVHLGLGTFYLLAPAIIGGNLDRAVEELEYAVKIAPDFATANARLAQAYKREGLQDKYIFYISRAKKLDPVNEVLREIKD